MRIFRAFFSLLVLTNLFSCALTHSDFATEVRGEPASLHWLMAHRGGKQEAHGNSLRAILTAAKEGVPVIEIDLRRSTNGEIFLCHGKHLVDEGVTVAGNPKAGIETLSSEEIRTLVYPGPEHDPIATYEEALYAIKPYRSGLELDIKNDSPDLTRQALQMAQHAGLGMRVIVPAEAGNIAEKRKLYPDAILEVRVYSVKEAQESLKYHPDIVGIDEDFLDDTLASDIHAAGAKISTKTLDALGDTAEHREALFHRGVNLILTDFPFGVDRPLQ